MQGRLMDKYFFLYFIAFIKKLDHFEGKNSYRVKIDVYKKKQKISVYIYTNT